MPPIISRVTTTAVPPSMLDSAAARMPRHSPPPMSAPEPVMPNRKTMAPIAEMDYRDEGYYGS